MKKLVAIAGTVLSLSALMVLGEGTITETRGIFGTPYKHTLAWVASTNGWVSGASSFKVRGTIERAVILGSPTGTAYTVMLLDESGIDVLAGYGTLAPSNVVVDVCPAIRMHNGSTSTVTNMAAIAVNDNLTLLATNAGSLKSGSVILYVR